MRLIRVSVLILAWHDIWQSKKYANGILAVSSAQAVGARGRDPGAQDAVPAPFDTSAVWSYRAMRDNAATGVLCGLV